MAKCTMAMWLIMNKIIVPKQWMHNYDIKNIFGKSLD